jgi:hypothetical protein
MDIEDFYREIVMRAIMEFESKRGFSAVRPTDIALDSPYTTEKRICADIELDDEALDKGFHIGMTTRQYKDDAN